MLRRIARASGDGGNAAPGGRDTDRLEAFSDAVIAIAITLLVLEIRVPEHLNVHSTSDLWDELGDLWPAYLGYLISFATIGIMWANHHLIFRHIARTDHYLVIINGFFLLCIGFLPFPTALLTEYLGHPGERAAIIVYSGWFLLTALTYNLLWRYPSRGRRLLEPEASPRSVAEITRRFNLGPPSYLLAFILAFVSTAASLVVLLLLALLYVLPGADVEG
jgi:uncharacterized membrane protein